MIRTDRYRALSIESKTLREGLSKRHGLDDRAQIVLRYAETVRRCKESLAEQNTSKVPNEKLIVRCNEVIANTKESFKNALVQLGANKECIMMAEGYLENKDVEQIHYLVLQLLAKQNPVMYGKKLAIFKETMQKQRG